MPAKEDRRTASIKAVKTIYVSLISARLTEKMRKYIKILDDEVPRTKIGGIQ